MKCPKCGYHSFEHLDDCKKCGQDLAEHKAKFNLKGFFFPGQTIATAASEAEDAATEAESDEDGGSDFGFDFLEEDDDQAGVDSAPEEDTSDADIPLGESTTNVSIDQPFGVDAESIPADDFAIAPDSDDKFEKGSDFSF